MVVSGSSVLLRVCFLSRWLPYGHICLKGKRRSLQELCSPPIISFNFIPSTREADLSSASKAIPSS